MADPVNDLLAALSADAPKPHSADKPESADKTEREKEPVETDGMSFLEKVETRIKRAKYDIKRLKEMAEENIALHNRQGVAAKFLRTNIDMTRDELGQEEKTHAPKKERLWGGIYKETQMIIYEERYG